jgi:hypothetical protein
MMWMVLLGLGVLGAAAVASRSRDSDAPHPTRERDPVSGVPVCDIRFSDLAHRPGRVIRIWLDCPGRAESEVQNMVNVLMETSPDMAQAALARWQARRSIETAPPGTAVTPETRDAVDRARRASDDEASGPGFNPGPMAGVERNARGQGIQLPEEQARLTPEDHVALDALRDEFRGGATTIAEGPAPEGFDAGNARTMAGPLAQHLTATGANYNRDRVRRFQESAGISPREPVGIYDCETKNALIHYGINRPPPPRHGISRNCTEHPYRRPIRG